MGNGKQQGGIKFEMGYLEKTWGIKYKSHTVVEDGLKIKMVVEFTKDAEDLPALCDCLSPILPGVTKKKIPLWFYFFDSDNVVLAKGFVAQIQGEITGKKGDAFRVLVAVPLKNALTQTRKIEARPEEEPLGKGEKKK